MLTPRPSRAILVLAILINPLPWATASADDDAAELARSAQAVLKTHCHRCHGVEYKTPRLDVLDHAFLIAERPEDQRYIEPGNADESAIWNRMGVAQDMPPDDVSQRPTAEELETVKKWIAAGAPEAVDPEREQVEAKTVLGAIRDHLLDLRSQDRRHQRYVTLAHLHNNPTVTAADLRLYRAAFSKLINSTSRRGSIVIPKLIDQQQLVFNIDLRKLGWDVETWQSVIRDYPYGVEWRDSDLAEIDEDINRMLGGAVSGDGISSIRADWFVRNASRAEKYHTLIGTPQTIAELETKLGVDVASDFDNGQLLRAGFAGSGVSRNNRLVDRHAGFNTKYYYRSYDFAKSFGRAVLSRFPLGPKSISSFDDFAFEHDGGEIIYSMPNGLHGYMLIDAEGNRLDEAPIKIVRDINEASGTPVIVNGVSCMGCHKRGLIDYQDAVQSAKVLGGKPLAKLTSIYGDAETIRTTLQSDRRQFLLALEQSTKPFLIEGEDYGPNLPFKTIADMREPIATTSRWYDRDIGAAEAAAELGFDTQTFFQAAVATNDKLRQLGVGPLSQDARIPRGMWDTQDESSSSIFQRVFVALGFGTAVRPIAE